MRWLPAICEWPQQMDLWQQWEQVFTDLEDAEHEAKALRFYRVNRKAMDKETSAAVRPLEPESRRCGISFQRE